MNQGNFEQLEDPRHEEIMAMIAEIGKGEGEPELLPIPVMDEIFFDRWNTEEKEIVISEILALIKAHGDLWRSIGWNGLALFELKYMKQIVSINEPVIISAFIEYQGFTGEVLESFFNKIVNNTEKLREYISKHGVERKQQEELYYRDREIFWLHVEKHGLAEDFVHYLFKYEHDPKFYKKWKEVRSYQ